MLTDLFGCVSLPGLWFLLICFAAGPSCCVPVSLSLRCWPEHRPRRWSGAELCALRGHSPASGYLVLTWRSLPLKPLGLWVECWTMWPPVASCKLWLMSFLLRERADIVGSKLIYLGKLRANAQTWSGGSTWKALVQGICHSALQLPLPRDLRGLLGGAESPVIRDLKKAFPFPKSGQRKVSALPSGAKR